MLMRYGGKTGLAAAALAALLVAACGGGDDAGDQTPRVAYGHLVSFGDSLSDVGSYDVSGVAAAGGGKFTVNGGDDRIWVERLAAQIGVGSPCAAQTGLNAVEAVVGFPPAPVTNHAGCTAYGQGGARVTDPVGPGNVALFNPADATTYGNALGSLTDPLVNQVARHLAASGGSFAADDLVTVLAGANDAFIQIGVFGATVGAGGDPTAASTAAVNAMVQAATELAALVNDEIVGHGAERVVVVNVPDLSQTPAFASGDPGVAALVAQMVQAFNATLASAVGGNDKVLLVDAYTIDREQNANPAQYALTDVSQPACDPLLVGSSLFCSAQTLTAGAAANWKYADGVHPTPYSHQLLTQLVARDLLARGWL